MKKIKGFTLIEMLLAIAILAVLSGAILISISAQRDKARATRMLSELSATIQPIYMCVADGGIIQSPSGGVGGGDICDLSPNYGNWPIKQDGFSNYVASNSTNFDSDSWYIRVDGLGIRVCCNSKMTGCKNLDSVAPCDANNP